MSFKVLILLILLPFFFHRNFRYSDELGGVVLIKKQFKNTLIYNENSVEFNKSFFDLWDKRFLHNIDSLYYTVKVCNEWDNDSGCCKLKAYLDNLHDKAVKSDFVIAENFGTEFICNGIGFSVYKYDLEIKNEFICFFANSCINKDTPEIIVQIRSAWLWLVGESRAVLDSYSKIKSLLGLYDIEISSVVENRIDYAYHTNYVQDPLNFFNPKKLYDMQISKFNRWRAEGDLSKNISMDYLGLGRRKSNNVYFRVYNKCQEVIRQGYKPFFLRFGC